MRLKFFNLRLRASYVTYNFAYQRSKRERSIRQTPMNNEDNKSEGVNPPGTEEIDRRLQIERRRPGRMTTVSPALVPLLRGTAKDLVGSEHPVAFNLTRDDSSPATGIAVSVIASIALYVAAGWVIGWGWRYLHQR